MTQYLSRSRGRIAYEDHDGGGPVVLCLPGMGDLRSQYRHLVPHLVAAGHRVVTMDLRGLGASDASFDRYTPDAVGDDVAALLEHLDARDAVVIGNSMAAASAVWAAAEAPDRVGRLVLIGPFVRDVPVNPLMALAFRVLLAWPWGRWMWLAFYPSLYKAGTPPDHAEHLAALGANLAEPGRMAAFRAMARASKAACEARIDEVRAGALVLMGTADPDFPDPGAEARYVAGRLGGRAVLIDGAGHYPHAEVPEVAARHVLDFLGDDGGTAWRAAQG